MKGCDKHAIRYLPANLMLIPHAYNIRVLYTSKLTDYAGAYQVRRDDSFFSNVVKDGCDLLALRRPEFEFFLLSADQGNDHGAKGVATRTRLGTTVDVCDQSQIDIVTLYDKAETASAGCVPFLLFVENVDAAVREGIHVASATPHVRTATARKAVWNHKAAVAWSILCFSPQHAISPV